MLSKEIIDIIRDTHPSSYKMVAIYASDRDDLFLCKTKSGLWTSYSEKQGWGAYYTYLKHLWVEEDFAIIVGWKDYMNTKPLWTNQVQQIIIVCQCGGAKLNLPHSHWCPRHKLHENSI